MNFTSDLKSSFAAIDRQTEFRYQKSTIMLNFFLSSLKIVSLVVLLMTCSNPIFASDHKEKCLQLLLGSNRVPTLRDDVYWEAVKSFANLTAPQFARQDPEVVAEVLGDLLLNSKQFEFFLESIRIQSENKIVVEHLDPHRIPNAVKGRTAYIRLTKETISVVFEIGPYFPAVTAYTGLVK